MLRVLLAVEDYNELLYLQTLLKKIGFDVEGIQNDRSFEEARLSLNPEIILLTAAGKRLRGIELASQIRKLRGFPKVVLLVAAGSSPLSDEEMNSVDGVIESPINSRGLLNLLAELGEINIDLLLEKYRRIKSNLSPDEDEELELLLRDNIEFDEVYDSEVPADKPASVASAAAPRAERYRNFLDKMERPVHDGFPRSRVVEYHKGIREKEDPKANEVLEEQRQNFVKALFDKKP